MHDHMKNLMLNPEFKRAHQARLIKFEQLANAAGERTLCGDPVMIPVAVHFQGVSNPDVACLRALAQSQIDILNNDYQGTNSDISTWINTASSSFPGVNYGETCIEFCIATQNHPSGSGLNDGEPAVTINTTSGDFDANWSGYLNIFVQSNTGVLGYSPLGGAGNGDGVVIDATAFGSGNGCGPINPQSPYDLGRTLTHELGHYLLLDHIWGGGCGQDDAIGDTPNSQNPYYGCPNIGASSCSSTDMHMNYMDYTNDACMYMFSDGQSSRMENYVSSNLQALVNNAAVVCGGGSGPTCSDGVQNGNETGVDCGGSCPPCQSGNVDAGVASITRPDDNICVPRFRPIIKVKNYGTQTITSLTIKYGRVGGATKTKNWTGSIAPNAQKSITLGRVNLGMGSRIFYAKTQNPNGQVDDNPANDRKEKAVIVDGNQLVKVIINPDNYGSETTWEILDDNNTVVASGGPYPDNNTSRRQKNVCLVEGCYTFRIEDTYGDGICCDYGNGNYRLRDIDNAIIVSSNGQFGFFEEQSFCVTYDALNYNGAKRDEKQPVSINENIDFIDVSRTGLGSEILVKDENGNVLDVLKPSDAGQAIRVKKSSYENTNIHVEIADKKGKVRTK